MVRLEVVRILRAGGAARPSAPRQATAPGRPGQREVADRREVVARDRADGGILGLDRRVGRETERRFGLGPEGDGAHEGHVDPRVLRLGEDRRLQAGELVFDEQNVGGLVLLHLAGELGEDEVRDERHEQEEAEDRCDRADLALAGAVPTLADGGPSTHGGDRSRRYEYAEVTYLYIPPGRPVTSR